MAGLLMLKAAVAAPSYSEDPRVCSLFNTWQPYSEPCQVPNCTACTLEHPTCGVYQPASATTSCAWRYLECRNGRVTKVLLGKLPPSSPPGCFGQQLELAFPIGRCVFHFNIMGCLWMDPDALLWAVLICMSCLVFCPCKECLQFSLACADYAAILSSGPRLTFGPVLGSALAGVDYLEELHLAGHVLGTNGSSWPAAIAALHKLRVLHLTGPASPGATLPQEWSGLSQLQSLWMLNMSSVQGEGAWLPSSHLQALRTSASLLVNVLAGTAAPSLLMSLHTQQHVQLLRGSLGLQRRHWCT